MANSHNIIGPSASTTYQGTYRYNRTYLRNTATSVSSDRKSATAEYVFLVGEAAYPMTLSVRINQDKDAEGRTIYRYSARLRGYDRVTDDDNDDALVTVDPIEVVIAFNVTNEVRLFGNTVITEMVQALYNLLDGNSLVTDPAEAEPSGNLNTLGPLLFGVPDCFLTGAD